MLHGRQAIVDAGVITGSHTHSMEHRSASSDWEREIEMLFLRPSMDDRDGETKHHCAAFDRERAIELLFANPPAIG